MIVRQNKLKRALAQEQHQLGLWVSLCHAYSAEIVAGAGFDWLLLDTEHSPNDVPDVLAQLQAVAPYPVSPVVRPSWNDALQQKRFLDIGTQTLLIPYVQNEEEAAQAVEGMRYPPRGNRGVGGTMRASDFGRNKQYIHECEKELCLLVQVETQEALNNLEAIARVDGVDGVFIGPADLSASMGHLGNPGHHEVQHAIEDAIRQVRALGKAPGILTLDTQLARRYIECGSLFTAVGMDVAMLARAADGLAAAFS